MSDSSTRADDCGTALVRIMKDAGMVIDYTRIVEYEGKRRDIPTLDIISAPMYLRDFNVACDHVASLVAKIEVALSAAKSNMESEEAKAKLERAPKYFEENKTLGALKDSSALRDTYLALDEAYSRSRQQYEALKALHKFVENKLEAFKRDYYSVKSIYAAWIGTPGSKTGYEGMTSGGKIGDTPEE